MEAETTRTRGPWPAGAAAPSALAVAATLRAGDQAYRYGGEELVLVLRDANVQEGLAAAERVRAAVAARRSRIRPTRQGS
jgi:diguanylate cyclase (GGDEF)-like protein